MQSRERKLHLSVWSAVALMIAPCFAAPVGNPASPLSASDLKTLKKIMEDQSVTYVQTIPKGMTLSGYVDTSYTKRFASAGQNASQVQAVTSGSATTEKLKVDMPLPAKNEWGAGFEVDVIHSSVNQ
jgi:hypothetical protein